MKIMKLILENFSSIKVGMKKNKIELDFSDYKNKICLIVGPNGSGKTSILSMLHPFADIGNLDVRNSNNLILEGKSGYKEITIRKNNIDYIIKHYYTAHKGKSHSVKSYIMKDDLELNPNGNVTSFKEVVRNELHIEPDYLKLIRLGSNVTSLIGMSPTERKNFMTKLMDDIGVFLDYYKSVNTKLRQLDGMLTMSINKLNKLGIDDINTLKDEISMNDEELKSIEKDYQIVNGNIELLRSKIDELGDINSVRIDYSDIKKKYTKMSKKMEKKTELKKLEYYTEAIQSYTERKTFLISEISRLESLITSTISQIDSLEVTVRDQKVQINKINNTNKEIQDLDELLVRMNKKRESMELSLGDFTPPLSKNELENLIIFLKNMQNILRTTYEFGEGPVHKVTSLMLKDKNVLKYIDNQVGKLESSDGEKVPRFIRNILNRVDLKNGEIDCCKDCVGKTLFNQIKMIIESESDNEDVESYDFYKSMESSYKNINTVLMNMEDYRDKINLLPYKLRDSFDRDIMLKKIGSLKYIYNEEKFNQLLSLVTEYETYVELCSRTKETEDMITRLKVGSGDTGVSDLIQKLESNISGLRNDIETWKESVLELRNELKTTTETITEYEDIRDAIENFEDVKEKYINLSNIISTHNELNDKLMNSSIRLNSLSRRIETCRSELDKKRIKAREYEIYNSDIKKMTKKYDEMSIVKDSLSSKQGIPLQFIGSYLRNTEDITNELLDIVYDGKISIDNFELTSSDFSIPYFNNDMRIPDVKYASQGELSFLSIALSFALSHQALKRYNIMLLDEIDGPLDVDNRWKFIKILERQIEGVDSEQCFLISHNDMFKNYPVDIIDVEKI